ncbi:TITAN-like protein isoform X1 [Daucus carota subsp. sativus]|uniref:TITAN-like protein isoform X1 n=1 Tax=Daucus carota subsp. sativus TaxID=79200 RepID=UPI0007EFEDA6|nr:PREDICTED: TITAN-like protein isoform X1 [Daucus carota subsp. sativus]
MNPRIHHRNAAPVKMKKKVKEEKNEYELCKVCKINHNLGRRHNFYPNHIKSLSSFLSRFQTKLSDVRFFLKNPTILLPEHAARNRLWCVFCDFELDEIDSSFACANAINHLASADHLKSVKDFLWRYGGGMDRIDSFRIVELDLAKWEKKCKLLNEAANNGSQRLLTGPVNDIHNELNSENFYNCDRNTIHNLNSSFTNGVVPLQNHTLEEYQVSGIAEFDGHVHGANSCTSTSSGTQFGYMDNQHASILNGRIGSHPNGGMKQVIQHERTNGERSFQGLQKLHRVPSIAGDNATGNVHSGGPPPWFSSTDKNLPNDKQRSGKSSKLNPKRVGAAWAERRKMEMEMEKRGEIVTTKFDSSWLPDFGRVWQSGSRKESKKEFQVEINTSHKDESQAVTPAELQPYVSIRQRTGK